jgi:hypothetical protein
VNDTSGVDAITLGVTPAGGVMTLVNGEQKDYAPGEWDLVIVQSSVGGDAISVRATVVPSIVHYVGSSRVSVNVGDAGGVQNIKASFNVNGVVGGPARGGSAAIAVNDAADSAARDVVMSVNGRKQIITGLAPAEISIGVEVEPVGPQGEGAFEGDTLSLTSGTGDDRITIRELRDGLETTMFNARGADAIVVGDGSLAGISSSLTAWGRPGSTGLLPGDMTVKLDDSEGTAATQFDLSVLRQSSTGAIQVIEFQATTSAKQKVSYRVQEVATATIDGGTGGNSFVVHDVESRLEGPGTVVTLNTGGGSDNVAVEATQPVTSLVVNGQGGDDVLKAGPIGPFGGVNGGLDFDGGGGVNTLIVQGPRAGPLGIPTVAVILTAGRVEHQGVEFRYTGVARLNIQNGWFNVNEFLGPIDLTITSEPSDIEFESSTMVEINASQKLTSLQIASGPVVLSPGGNKEIHTGLLDIGGDGSLDLTDNQMQVHYNIFIPLSSIRKWIFGRQIFSSRADAAHNLGYADGSGGIDFAPFGTVTVKYTLYGDANLDRRVDFVDLAAMAQHYNDTSGNRNWDEGDFTYEGNVDFADLSLLSQNYNTAMEVVAGAAPVPGPPASARPPVRRPQVRPR